MNERTEHEESDLKPLHLKIPPPIVAAVFGLVIWQLSELLPGHAMPESFRHSIALILLALAACIDIWALFSFRRAKTTIDPRYPHQTSAIVCTGIYKYSRNPMYLGLSLMLAALSIWLGARFGLFVVAAFILYMNRFQIQPEEMALEKQFGDEYLDYKSRVRRWI